MLFHSMPLLAGVLLAALPAAALLIAQHVHPSADTAGVAVPLGIPMDRMGSGTSWIPDAVSLWRGAGCSSGPCCRWTRAP